MTIDIDRILVVYAILCLTHLGLQMVLAFAHHRRQGRDHALEGDFDATVSVIYPVFNESPGVLARVMEQATKCLDLPGLEVIVVDDGSPNRYELAPIYERYQQARIQVIYQDNKGKREAQYTGLAVAKGEFIVTVDSDTLIDIDGIRRIIAPLQRNPHIGAVCGEVLVENRSTNLLTRLIGLRYWTAFNLERAAQSFFNAVLCCSGPFSAYRADVLHRVKASYIAQRFCGRRCTYGDDRHLTNLVLAEGLAVSYQPGAVASTFVPETLSEYIKQQNRWNKSFYREMLWTMKIANKVHPYSMLDMLLQPLLFLGFTVALSRTLMLLAQTSTWTVAADYLTSLVVMSSARAIYGLLFTFDIGFLLFVLYGFLHVIVLVPVRFKSILTLTDNNWGTRAIGPGNPYRDFAVWAGGYLMLLLVIAGGLALLIPEATIMNAAISHEAYMD